MLIWWCDCFQYSTLSAWVTKSKSSSIEMGRATSIRTTITTSILPHEKSLTNNSDLPLPVFVHVWKSNNALNGTTSRIQLKLNCELWSLVSALDRKIGPRYSFFAPGLFVCPNPMLLRFPLKWYAAPRNPKCVGNQSGWINVVCIQISHISRGENSNFPKIP